MFCYNVRKEHCYTLLEKIRGHFAFDPVINELRVWELVNIIASPDTSSPQKLKTLQSSARWDSFSRIPEADRDDFFKANVYSEPSAIQQCAAIMMLAEPKSFEWPEAYTKELSIVIVPLMVRWNSLYPEIQFHAFDTLFTSVMENSEAFLKALIFQPGQELGNKYRERISCLFEFWSYTQARYDRLHQSQMIWKPLLELVEKINNEQWLTTFRKELQENVKINKWKELVQFRSGMSDLSEETKLLKIVRECWFEPIMRVVDYVAQLSFADQQIIFSWTRACNSINQNRDSAARLSVLARLDEIIRNAPSMDEPWTLYRGHGTVQPNKVKMITTKDRMVSYTYDHSIADGFCDGNVDHGVFSVLVPAHVPFIIVDVCSEYCNEGEVLLPLSCKQVRTGAMSMTIEYNPESIRIEPPTRSQRLLQRKRKRTDCEINVSDFDCKVSLPQPCEGRITGWQIIMYCRSAIVYYNSFLGVDPDPVKHLVLLKEFVFAQCARQCASGKRTMEMEHKLKTYLSFLLTIKSKRLFLKNVWNCRKELSANHYQNKRIIMSPKCKLWSRSSGI